MMPIRPTLFLALLLATASSALATLDPRPFTFPSADGHYTLQGVEIPSQGKAGVVVVVNGLTESWLKYDAFFRDLHRAGYTVYSYDHRGQGLSPHLVPSHLQIAHIDDSFQYSRDLAEFLKTVRTRENGAPVDLIAHSMGCAVTTEYLSDHGDRGIRKVVLCSPMFRINTAPVPEPLIRLVLGMLQLVGQGASYAPGIHDVTPQEPFQGNRTTSDPQRWGETMEYRRLHPDTVTGGPSVDWVTQALGRSPLIWREAENLGPDTMILLAGHDRLVLPQAPLYPDPRGPSVVLYPGAQHEILMERDPIRRDAIRDILAFLKAPPLPWGTR